MGVDPQEHGLPWRLFRPEQWRESGSCYPCLVWDTHDNIIFTPCDPWTMPPEDDYSGWLCIPTKILIPPK